MRQLRRILILLPNLNRLIRFARDEPRSRQIELRREDSVLGIQTPRLRHRRGSLKTVSRTIIPKVHGAVIGTAHHHPVVVHGEGIDDGLVTRKVFDESSVGSHPFFEVVGRSGEEGVFEGGLGEGADGFLVVGERRHAFAGGEVP